MVRIELTLTIMSQVFNCIYSVENTERTLVTYYAMSAFLSTTGILLVAV